MDSIKKLLIWVASMSKLEILLNIIVLIYIFVVLGIIIDPLFNGFTNGWWMILYAGWVFGAVLLTQWLYEMYQLVMKILTKLDEWWTRYILDKISPKLHKIINYPTEVSTNILIMYFYTFLIDGMTPDSGSRFSLIILFMVATLIAISGTKRTIESAKKFMMVRLVE